MKLRWWYYHACYTSAFSEVIYADFYAKILDWNFCLFNENSQILVVVLISKLNFSFSFCFVDENCGIFVVVVVFVTKINLFSSTKIFVFFVVDEKTLLTTQLRHVLNYHFLCCRSKKFVLIQQTLSLHCIMYSLQSSMALTCFSQIRHTRAGMILVDLQRSRISWNRYC